MAKSKKKQKLGLLTHQELHKRVSALLESERSYLDFSFEPLNQCCGVLEIGDFPNALPLSTGYNGTGRPVPASSFALQMADQIVAEMDSQRVTLAIATTIPSQKAGIAALKAIGFKAVATGKSSKSGNLITIWTLVRK